MAVLTQGAPWMAAPSARLAVVPDSQHEPEMQLAWRPCMIFHQRRLDTQ